MDEVGFDNFVFVEGRIRLHSIKWYPRGGLLNVGVGLKVWFNVCWALPLPIVNGYRNAMVHFKGPDGYTHAEHERILSKMQDFLWVNSQDLLLRNT
jgi:hypothetical protein